MLGLFHRITLTRGLRDRAPSSKYTVDWHPSKALHFSLLFLFVCVFSFVCVGVR